MTKDQKQRLVYQLDEMMENVIRMERKLQDAAHAAGVHITDMYMADGSFTYLTVAHTKAMILLTQTLIGDVK
jgi:hypothetical protein